MKRYVNLAVALLLTSSLTAFSQAPAVRAESQKTEDAIVQANVLFEQAVASPTVPGISVAVAGGEGVIWARGFGWADLESRVPMSTRTKMRIGSVAKPFTAAALMRLYEQGKIDLDADVRTYVPAWPGSQPVITLRQLTSHTSGIRHYEGDEFLSNRYYPTVVDRLAIFKDSPLKFQPGTDQAYSTYAWTLVSAAIEGGTADAVSGRSCSRKCSRHWTCVTAHSMCSLKSSRTGSGPTPSSTAN